MRRREFLAASGAGLAVTGLPGVFVGCAALRQPGELAPLDVFGQLIAQNDASVPGLLARQQLDESHRYYGGVADGYGMYQAGPASGLVRALAVAFTTPGSRYAGAAELVRRLAAAARFLLSVQHADGTIDLITTNFHSPPDTGFVLEWICSATGLLRESARSTPHSGLEAVLADLDRFIVAGAQALAIGGVHTPNHRWVVCMALARANALHPEPEFVRRIDEWLAEGIDIDADGQFTERSTSIYSPLTDRCLITVARLLERPALLEPVRRNLEMTMFYVHADGEVATEGSRRQDQYRQGSLGPYYYPYRYLAQLDQNGRFAAMTRWIEAIAIGRLTRDAVFFAEQPTLRGPLPASAPLPEDYERHFAHSDLVRVRRRDASATILGGNPTAFSFHKGAAAVVMRFASAFFGKGQFVGDRLRKDGAAWVLRQELQGPYYQPLPDNLRRRDGDWRQMPRESRRQTEVQQQRATLRITERGSGEPGVFEVDIEIVGTDRVPVAVELGFRSGGRFLGGGVEQLAPGTFLLARSECRHRLGADTISVVHVAGAPSAHRWTQLRGALPKLDGDSLYLTGFTPFRTKLRIG